MIENSRIKLKNGTAVVAPIKATVQRAIKQKRHPPAKHVILEGLQ